MSPAIAKTTDRDIVSAARRIIRRRGVEGLALRDVAEAVGIRAPSLYKRFDDKAALLKAVKDDALLQLEAALRKAGQGHPPALAFTRMAAAYREFARTRPEIYRLIHRAELKNEDHEAERRAAAPGLEVMEALVGQAHALKAARCASSFLHGFVTMEIDGNFGHEGSADEAFTFSVYVILQGLVKSEVR